MNKKLLSLSGLALVGLVALPAYASTFVAIGLVNTISLKDNANNSGSAKQLEIEFTAAVSQCTGSSSSTITIASTESPLFEDWVKLAEAAKLSGKQLRVGTSNGTGSCKTWYMRMEP